MASTDSARVAAEAIRQLNHDTLNVKEMTAPEIHSVVRALTDLVDRLPQAFEQLAQHLDKQLRAGAVRMEDGRDPIHPVGQVTGALRQAAALAAPVGYTHPDDPAGDFSEAVHEASGWLFNMGAPWADDED